jgi:hypothetical protein
MFACLVAMSRDAMPGPNRSLSPAAAACMGSVADNNFSASGLRRLLDESGAGMNGGRRAGERGFKVSWWPQLPARDVSASLQKTSFPAVIKQRLQDKTGGSTHSETRSTLPPARFSGFPQERHGWALGPCCFPFCFPLLSLSASFKKYYLYQQCPGLVFLKHKLYDVSETESHAYWGLVLNEHELSLWPR